MSDLQFTLQDCDDVLNQCLEGNNIRTKNFEIIPRQNNYIFIITTDRNETIYLYAKVKSKPPLINKIYEDFKSVLKVRLNLTPKFYCGKTDLLFFEDLTCQKFQTSPGLFNLKYIKQVFTVLSEFHAAGFAYEIKTTKKLNTEYDLSCCNFDVDEVEDLLWSLVDNKERLNEVKEKLKKRQFFDCPKTLCHSNLSWGNILFHYDNGNPDQCKLVNFKGKLYASPVYDVLQVVFFNTDEEFQKRYLEEALSFYYSRLEEQLNVYKININSVLTLEEFKLSCHNVLPLIKLETAILKPEEEMKQEVKTILAFPKITKEDCYIIVKNVITSVEYDLLAFDTTPLEENLQLLTIKIRESLEETTIICVVKSKSKKEVHDGFAKEVFIFCTFSPKVKELEINLLNNVLPLCLFHNPENLVFQDFTALFQALDRVDFKVLSIVLKKLARLHACSLIFEEKMSEKLKLQYRLTNDYKFLQEQDAFIAVINFFPEFQTDDKFEPSNRFRNVVSHGNLTQKNILIKFDNDNPVDCLFINFENTKYCPPAYDFLSVLNLLKDETKNDEELKRIYHDELAQVLASYNYSVEKCCSFQEFTDSLQYYEQKVRVQTIIEENMSDLKKGEDWKSFVERKCEDSIFKARLRENVAEFYHMLHNL